VTLVPGPSGTAAVVGRLADLIVGVWGDWSGPVIEESILGTRDPNVIAGMALQGAADLLGSAPVAVEGYHASAGMVIRWVLADGAPVVTKIHGSERSRAHLEAVDRIRLRLVAGGFPCARPLAGPSPLGTGWVTAESTILDPGPSADRDIVASAAGLVRLVRSADGVDATGLSDGPTSPIGSEPRPDRVDTRRVDAARLVARRAMAGDTTRPLIGHLDWSARNVRWDRYGLVAVFDLDSLGTATDAAIAGRAAAVWSTTGAPEDRPVPDAACIESFIYTYQRARGYRFGVEQQRAAWGAALATICDAADHEARWGFDGPFGAALEFRGDELVERCGN
jgi:hypothetical protein